MSADALLAALAAGPPELTERESIQAVARHGRVLVASGQVAAGPDGLVATGLVGDAVDLAGAQLAAWVCARNVLEAVRAEAGGLDRVRAVRITVYVASAPGFAEQHLVADAATRVLHDVLGPERGTHARAAIGVAGLPLGSAVEVDGVFELDEG